MSSNVYHRLAFHFAWATKYRAEIFVGKQREWIISQIAAEATKRSATVHACNVMPDHAHLLVSLSHTCRLSDFIGQVKGATSHEFNKAFAPEGTRLLDWQEGYGVFSLRTDEVPKIIYYVEDQEAIHAARRANPRFETTEE